MKKYSVGYYPYNPCAMGLTVKKHGDDIVVTVNLGDYAVPESDILLMPFTSFVDVNNVPPSVIRELIDDGVMEPMTRWGRPAGLQSGFVFYPQYQFNEDFLRECDPKGCQEYVEAWQKHYAELYPDTDDEEDEV